MLPPAAAGRLSGSGCVPSGLAPAGWPSFGPPPHHSAAALSRSFLGRCCPFVGCGFAANARAALPAALVLAGSCCVLGSGFFLFARAGQRQRAKKKNENISPAQNLGAKRKNPLCPSIQYVAALAGNQRTIETKKRQIASSLKSRDPGTPPVCRLRREQRQRDFVVSGGPFLFGWVGLGCC